MFDIPNTKTFMDSVHGYITVPKCLVSNIIDTEAFQRLRNIDQTGMRILYPNAKHDRFSHSLGVYYLGSKAVNSLLDNFLLDDYWCICSDSSSVIYWAKNKILFLIACLLHDIGHSPFSHALEDMVLKNSTDDGLLTERLIREMNKRENFSETVSEIKAAPHEKIGALFILEHLEKNIERIYDELIEMQYPMTRSTDILYAEHYKYNPIINKSTLREDVCFIVRMILGLKYKNYEPEKQIRNCFIELLNGNNFDVDKLDYIIRDTKMSGISNIAIDVERLLNSVCIITKTKYLNSININVDGVVSFIRGGEAGNINITGCFGGTFLFDSKAEVEIKKGSTFVSMISVNHGKIKYADFAPITHFSSDTIITQNGEKISRFSGEEHFKSLPDLNGDLFECSIKNARIESDSGFKFIADNDPNTDSWVELQINGNCDINIKGDFRIKSPVSCFENTTLKGDIKEVALLGNFIKRNVPCKDKYNEFVVGFNKQAINVIANVLEARDYLYLWVYAHHKVMYYANFLIPAISKELLLNISSNDFPIWKLNYDNIVYIDDSYIWTAIKFIHYRFNEKNEWNKLCDELLSRKYKTSLFKSLAEYDLLFESFSYDEKLLIKQFFIENYRQDYPFVGAEQITAGYLSQNIVEKFKKYSGIETITNIVYVDASYSAKKINVNNTFIKMNEDFVAAISEIPLLSNRISKEDNTNQYFYLYFETESTEQSKKNKESEALKEALIDFIKIEIKALRKK